MWEKLLREILKKDVDSVGDPSVIITKSKIRDILGIEELTIIRKWVISEALKSIKSDT